MSTAFFQSGVSHRNKKFKWLTNHFELVISLKGLSSYEDISEITALLFEEQSLFPKLVYVKMIILIAG